jgi:hypothetical protein
MGPDGVWQVDGDQGRRLKKEHNRASRLWMKQGEASRGTTGTSVLVEKECPEGGASMLRQDRIWNQKTDTDGIIISEDSEGRPLQQEGNGNIRAAVSLLLF